ncbi:MAG: hypothetical protein HGB10_06120 [Coriobacteriia bacterium]|nr:hypothetical protein [Coriobacteriia bacterium]
MDGTQAAQQGGAGTAQLGGPPSGFPGGPGGAPGGRSGLMFLGPWGGIIGIALLVLTYVVLAVALWRFLSKAGLTPAVALLMLVPVVNLGVVLWAAFTEWPALREVDRLKQQLAVREVRGTAASRGDEPVDAPGEPVSDDEGAA